MLADLDSRTSPAYLRTIDNMTKKKDIVTPLVAIIMGSKSDWETMQCASQMLKEFGVPHECKVVSAHRTPSYMKSFAEDAQKRGFEVIIAGAGGAAHLPGMTASHTTLPVLGVPVESKALNGLDSLLSIAQMPSGVPVGTLAIGKTGAKNAGLLAVAILALSRPSLQKKLLRFRSTQTKRVLKDKVR
jgi:5-(carboxyamino)imidazole ribonucleotide mutase